MRIITSSHHGLRSYNVPPPVIVKRFGVSGRSLFITLDYIQKFLLNQAEWLNVHRIPFKDEKKATHWEDFRRYSFSYIAKGGFHLGWVRGGMHARVFAYTCDRLPFYWHNQLLHKDGRYLTVNVIRSLFNPHFDKLRMDKAAYAEVFYEVLRMLGKKAGRVPDLINREAEARSKAKNLKLSAQWDTSSQEGDGVGQITDPCLMIAENIFEKEYEPSAFALDEYPRYFNPDEPDEEKRIVVVEGPTKGQIVQVDRPMYRLCGLGAYAYIVAAVFEKNNLVVHGVMPINQFWELTKKTRVLMQFDKDREPSWFRIMPIGSPHWIPMEVFMRDMYGFDAAVAAGLVIINK